MFYFTYFERERERKNVCAHVIGVEGRETRERIPSRLHTVRAEPNMGLDPTTLGL